MKKLLILLLVSFGFIGSIHANVITDLFFPTLEKYNDCKDSLEKQNISNRSELCIGYILIIPPSYIREDLDFHPR
jgi:hypothetical protein